MKKCDGLNLIEMILVIFVIGVLTVTVLKSWDGLHRKHSVIEAQHDVGELKSALSRYFHITGCDEAGKFNGNLMPSLETLGLKNLEHGREPWITEYSAHIISIGENKNNKPLFEFKLTANTKSGLNEKQIALLAGALNAKLNGTQLTWLMPLIERNPRRNNLIDNGVAQCAQ